MQWLVWALLSAVFAGATAVLAKIGVANINSTAATAVRTTVVFLFTWLIVLFTDTRSLTSIPKRSWLFLLLSGIATGLSWLCYFRALQLGHASQVAPIDKLSVVVAMVLAAIFLHEQIGWLHWIGGSMIFLGAIVLAYA